MLTAMLLIPVWAAPPPEATERPMVDPVTPTVMLARPLITDAGGAEIRTMPLLTPADAAPAPEIDMLRRSTPAVLESWVVLAPVA